MPIRRALASWLPPLVRAKQPLRWDRLSSQALGREARAARRLESVYHVGQDRIWDGRDVLAELHGIHGDPQLSPEKLAAIRNIFSMILWGELAAWKISAELAACIEPIEAKLAATSQAHDEARHFYVMHDYLSLIGAVPGEVPTATGRILNMVLNADSLAKKLVGMQLMIEPIALTVFAMARRSNIEPILCDLLAYYERDEARHVTLGVQYLPHLISDMKLLEALDYWVYQARIFSVETRAIRDMEHDFRALGFPPREVFRMGQGKQLTAVKMLTDELDGVGEVPMRIMRAILDFAVVYRFPEGEEGQDRLSRLRNAARAAWNTEAEYGELVPG